MGVPKAGHLHSNWGTPGTVTSSLKWGAAFLGGCRCLVLLKTRPRAPKELEDPSFMTSKTWKGWSDSWKWLPLPELRLSASTSLAGFQQKPSFRSEVDGGVFQGLGRKQFVQHEGANRREAEAPGAHSSCLLWCLGCSTSVGSKRGSWWNVALVWHSLSLSLSLHSHFSTIEKRRYGQQNGRTATASMLRSLHLISNKELTSWCWVGFFNTPYSAERL